MLSHAAAERFAPMDYELRHMLLGFGFLNAVSEMPVSDSVAHPFSDVIPVVRDMVMERIVRHQGYSLSELFKVLDRSAIMDYELPSVRHIFQHLLSLLDCHHIGLLLMR